MADYDGCRAPTNQQRIDRWEDRRALVACLSNEDPVDHDMRRAVRHIKGLRYKAWLLAWQRTLPILRAAWNPGDRLISARVPKLMAPPSRRRAS